MGPSPISRSHAALVIGLTLWALSGCDSDDGRAKPPPHAGNYEAFDGAGRHQRMRLRVGDRLVAAISDRGLSPCLGVRPGCIRFSLRGTALASEDGTRPRYSICNDAAHRCVYARHSYRTVRPGRARVAVRARARCRTSAPCSPRSRVLMTVDVDVRKAPPGYAAKRTERPDAVAGAVRDDSPPPRGLYQCYQFDPSSGYMYSGGFRLVSETDYTAVSGGEGEYRVDGDEVSFLGGPYQDFSGKLRSDESGNEVIDLTLRSEPAVKQNCSHSTE